MVGEGVVTAVWLAGLLPSLSMQDAPTLAAILGRAAIAAALIAAGRGLDPSRPATGRVAAIALVASAGFRTAEIAAALTPSDLSPTFRTPVIVGYWLYAAAASWYVTRSECGRV
jgi:hypothetical protein